MSWNPRHSSSRVVVFRGACHVSISRAMGRGEDWGVGALDAWLVPAKRRRSSLSGTPNGGATTQIREPQPFREALPLRPPDPRRFLPRSPPTPKAPNPSAHPALTLKGELLEGSASSNSSALFTNPKLSNPNPLKRFKCPSVVSYDTSSCGIQVNSGPKA